MPVCVCTCNGRLERWLVVSTMCSGRSILRMWHLPDGRALRVVTTPNPEGGVTYLYEDVTERLDLHRRYDALIKVQSETLDHLAEAVAVFGSDGRVRLHNPAFHRMWKLSQEALDQRPHVGSPNAIAPAEAAIRNSAG